MIDRHVEEIEAFKVRLSELERTEIGRLDQEVQDKEELFNNHGKTKNFFNAPMLHTKKRVAVRGDK